MLSHTWVCQKWGFKSLGVWGAGAEWFVIFGSTHAARGENGKGDTTAHFVLRDQNTQVWGCPVSQVTSKSAPTTLTYVNQHPCQGVARLCW